MRGAVGGSEYTVTLAEPRDEFPNNFVGDLVHTERGWVVNLPGWPNLDRRPLSKFNAEKGVTPVRIPACGSCQAR